MEDQEFVPKIGKGTLPSVSDGMYRDSFFLFREYIQNSADSIDEAIRKGILNKNEAQIEISIDEEERRIVIQDNGVGISKDLAESYLVNVGDSKKDPKVCKGRFGIGRLGGLGYCGKVIFETSAKGEKYKSKVIWNATQWRELINDFNNDSDAITVIQLVTESRREVCDEDSHYFTVTLEGVSKAHDELLDVDEVRKYLTQVAPVRFDKTNFRFADKIYKFLADNKLSLCEYRVNLDNDPVYKCYEDIIRYKDSKGTERSSIEIKDVCCDLIKSDGQTYGWYWVARTDTANSLPSFCYQKGLRLKQWNIQIGNENCLSQKELWSEERGNNYFVGEIHVLDTSLIPNSRRDYFKIGEECRELEFELRRIFAGLTKVFRIHSDVQILGKDEKTKCQLEDQLNEKEKKDPLFNEEERQKEVEKINKAKEKVEKDKRKIKRLEDTYLCEDEGKKGSESSIVPKQTEIDFIGNLPRELIIGILRDNRQARSITIQEDESKRPKLVIQKEPQLPPKPKGKNRRVDSPLDEGERALLSKVREVLRDNLSSSQFDQIWVKILNKICVQEEE